MSRFYGELSGNRGDTSRQGDAYSGMSGHIRGWHVGAAVEMHANEEHDICEVFATGGSSGYGRTHLGTLEVAASPNSVVFRPSVELRDLILKAERRKPADDRPRSVIVR